jgi:hypothetical protein
MRGGGIPKEGSMDSQRLPKRFPVGTRYVVEGRAGGGRFIVHLRYLQLPDGRRLALPLEAIRWQVSGRAPVLGKAAFGRKRQKKH